MLRLPESISKLPHTKLNTLIPVDGKSLNSMDKDKLRLEHVLFRDFFQTSSGKIVSHVKELLAKAKLANVSTIVLVGGYAESKLLQDFVRTGFSNKTVIVPNQPGLAVLKGAVTFGYDPSVIAERVCRFTYGIEADGVFDEKRHTLESKYTNVDGNLRASSCFDVHCKIGQNVKTDVFQASHSYLPVSVDQISVSLPLYACPRDNPVYTGF